MTIHVEQLNTEVIAEPEPRPAPTEEESPWQALDRQRALRARLERDAARTHAAGYDD